MKILINERLSQHQYTTPEGYLVCTDAILARTGKQEYRRSELFLDGDDSVIEVDRPASEVFDSATIASFENKPVTIEHPDEDVNSSNWKEYQVGFVRDVRQGKDGDQDVLIGNLIIQDEEAIELIQSGKMKELSCGYNCDIKDEENACQKHIRGNHVALCERGRAGNARIIDSVDDEQLTIGKVKSGYYFVVAADRYKRYNINAIVSAIETNEDDARRAKRSLEHTDGIQYRIFKMHQYGILEIKDCIIDAKPFDQVIGRKLDMYNIDASIHDDVTTLCGKEENIELFINELRRCDYLVDDMVEDTLVTDPSVVDVEHYVEGKNGVWFAKDKSESTLLNKAYCSADKGKTWHKCYLEKKSASNNQSNHQTQAGKHFFRTSGSFNGPRTSIGRNVLTWYTNNGIHKVDFNLEIDHVNGNYLDDRLSNLERVSPQENIKRRNEMTKKHDSIKDVSPETIAALIKDEEEAIAAYQKAIEKAKAIADEKAIARYEEIIKDEQEHIKELKQLSTKDSVRDVAMTITTQCYIIDGDKILVQDRVGPVWKGLAVPGGHAENKEDVMQSCIREVKEETGLDVSNLELIGTSQYHCDVDGDCIAMLYKTSTFSGELKSSEEGEVKWMSIADVLTSNNCAEGFKELVKKYIAPSIHDSLVKDANELIVDLSGNDLKPFLMNDKKTLEIQIGYDYVQFEKRGSYYVGHIGFDELNPKSAANKYIRALKQNNLQFKIIKNVSDRVIDKNLGEEPLKVGQTVRFDPAKNSTVPDDIMNDSYVVEGFWYKGSVVKEDVASADIRWLAGILIKSKTTGKKYSVNRYQLKDSVKDVDVDDAEVIKVIHEGATEPYNVKVSDYAIVTFPFACFAKDKNNEDGPLYPVKVEGYYSNGRRMTGKLVVAIKDLYSYHNVWYGTTSSEAYKKTSFSARSGNISIRPVTIKDLSKYYRKATKDEVVAYLKSTLYRAKIIDDSTTVSTKHLKLLNIIKAIKSKKK